MTNIIAPHGGYRKTISFGFVCLIYHATTVFCKRNYSYKTDPLGKTSGQMIGAARSARQNIVEASSRAGTSTETEMRLLDVAKGSLQELAGDYEAFLLDAGSVPWAGDDPRTAEFRALRYDLFQPAGGADIRHDFGEHFLRMRARFAPILEADDPISAANGILLTIDRASGLLHRQMEKNAETFVEGGGFTERMSAARIEARDAQRASCPTEDSPRCPECGSKMQKRLARKGRNAGNAFWSCVHYPDCTGTRPC